MCIFCPVLESAIFLRAQGYILYWILCLDQSHEQFDQLIVSTIANTENSIELMLIYSNV